MCEALYASTSFRNWNNFFGNFSSIDACTGLLSPTGRVDCITDKVVGESYSINSSNKNAFQKKKGWFTKL
jgi:hypothetical protein